MKAILTILSLAALNIAGVTAVPIAPYQAHTTQVASYDSGYDESVFDRLRAVSHDGRGFVEYDTRHAGESMMSSRLRVPAIKGRVPITLELVVDLGSEFS